MMRTHYKPRTHHRDAYGHGDTVGMMLRCNGRDLYPASNASEMFETPHDAARKHVHRAPLVRKLTDREVAEQRHYASLAAKYEQIRAVA